MKANSEKTKQSKKATRRVLAGVLCGASVLSLVLSLVMPPISQAIANDDQAVSTEATVADASALGEDAGADENVLGEEAGAGNSTGKDAENRKSDDAEGGEGEDAAAADPAADGAGPRALRSPRMMDSLSIRSLLLQMKVRFRDLKQIRMGSRCWREIKACLRTLTFPRRKSPQSCV